ncbi:MAG: glycosyltransferase family 9 protein [Desulfovibrio sp.]
MDKVLVIQLARFGDLMQTKRLLLSLAQTSEVHILIDKSLASLAELVFPNVTVHTVFAHKNSNALGKKADFYSSFIIDNAKTFHTLKETSFSQVYNLNFSGLNHAVAGLFPPKKVQGHIYHNGQHCYSKWTALTFKLVKNRRLGINLVDIWGAYAPQMIPAEDVNPKAEYKDIPIADQTVGIVMAGRESRRSLPLETLTHLANSILQKGQSITLLGTDLEKRDASRLVANISPAKAHKVLDLTGKTNWESLAQTLSDLYEIITPDTGTMHLAAHLGTPVKGFFLSSAWCFETGPYGEGHTVYQARTDCAPCLESAPCPYGTKCNLPFSSPDFLRYFNGKSENLPTGVIHLTSTFDALGCQYAPTDESKGIGDHWQQQEARRSSLRGFICEHLRQSQNSTHLCSIVPEHDFIHARELYQSADWMTEFFPEADRDRS